MITRNQFEKLYPLVNEIVAFSNSLANEDSLLFRQLNERRDIYLSNELTKIVRSNILADILYCYFALGYHQNYDGDWFVLFDLLQYAFWFEKNHFTYEDFVEYASSQSNIRYFLRGFNNAKKEIDTMQFSTLSSNLIKVDPSRGAVYISILEAIATTLSEYQDMETCSKDELMNLLTNIESLSFSKDDNNEWSLFDYNQTDDMFTNEEYEERLILARKVVRFASLLTDKADCGSDLYKYLESIGCEFDNNRTLKGFVQLFIENDILNCYFFLGYQQIYNRELYLLLDMIEYGFHFQDIPKSYDEFKHSYWQYEDYFRKVFDIKKDSIKSQGFPELYIFLNEVSSTRANEYVILLQKIVAFLSANQNVISGAQDSRINLLMTNPQAFLYSEDDNNESIEIEDNNDYLQNVENSNNYITGLSCKSPWMN